VARRRFGGEGDELGDEAVEAFESKRPANPSRARSAAGIGQEGI
jgi:hypothetical protein